MSEKTPEEKVDEVIPKPVKKAEDFENVMVDRAAGVKHGSQLGREPEYVAEETFKPEEPIDTGRVAARRISEYKLDELTKDYYMFSLAPLYYMLPIKVDLLYQFGKDLQLDRVKDVITYKSPSLMLKGLGEWGCILQGIPAVYKDLFGTWARQLVFPDRRVSPYQYWRVSSCEVGMLTPGVVSTAAPVDVFLPSGVDFSFQAVRLPNGVYGFKKVPPQEWVAEEARRFFIKTGG